jgi:hypothetical protein
VLAVPFDPLPRPRPLPLPRPRPLPDVGWTSCKQISTFQHLRQYVQLSRSHKHIKHGDSDIFQAVASDVIGSYESFPRRVAEYIFLNSITKKEPKNNDRNCKRDTENHNTGEHTFRGDIGQ